jgi:L-iditol 2-dehydrogenase
MAKMRAIVFTGPEKLEVRKLDVPKPGPGEVLIRVKVCNLCTTEQGRYLGTRPINYPYIGGHEFGGIVEEVGLDVKEEDIAVGDHVACGYSYCGQCWDCKKGIFTNCRALNEDDIRYGGYEGMFGLADYLVKPVKTVYRFDKSISFEEIGFEEPLGTVVHGQKRLSIQPGDTVAVFGAGTMGMLNMLMARVHGAKTVIIDIKQERLEKAKGMGCDFVINSKEEDVEDSIKKLTEGRGADHVIVAVGNTIANNQALRIVRHKGNVLFFAAGYPKPEITVDPNALHYTEAALIGTYGGDPDDFRTACELINSGKIDVKALLDKKYTVDEAEAAFKRSTSGSAYRVTIEF